MITFLTNGLFFLFFVYHPLLSLTLSRALLILYIVCAGKLPAGSGKTSLVTDTTLPLDLLDPLSSRCVPRGWLVGCCKIAACIFRGTVGFEFHLAFDKHQLVAW